MISFSQIEWKGTTNSYNNKMWGYSSYFHYLLLEIVYKRTKKMQIVNDNSLLSFIKHFLSLKVIFSNFFMFISNDRRFGRICAPFWRGMMELSPLMFGRTRQKVKLYYTHFSLLMKGVQDTTFLDSYTGWDGQQDYITHFLTQILLSQDTWSFSLVHCCSVYLI